MTWLDLRGKEIHNNSYLFSTEYRIFEKFNYLSSTKTITELRNESYLVA